MRLQKNTDQAAHEHWRLVRNCTACPEMLFDKDSMSKRHRLYMLIWVSPLFDNQGRRHKQWGLISVYICNVWPMKFFQENFEKKDLTNLIMLLIKSIYPMWTHPWLKKKWGTPKRNAAKCYIMCTFQDVKLTQETAGSGLNRLYNVLCLLWNIHSGAPLPRIYSITNTKHWITYTSHTLYHSHAEPRFILFWKHCRSRSAGF